MVEDVEFGLGRGYRARPLWQGCVFLVLAAVAYVVLSHVGGPTLGGVAVFPLLISIGYFTAYLRLGRMRTRLTPAGIEVRRWSTRLVPWSSISSIEAASYDTVAEIPIATRSGAVLSSQQRWRSGRKLAAVRIVRTSGHRIMLPAPLVTEDQSDPEFDDKVRLIQAHWQEATGKVSP